MDIPASIARIKGLIRLLKTSVANVTSLIESVITELGGWVQDIIDTIPLDLSTEAVINIDYEHHEVHSGSHFFAKGWFDSASAANSITLFAFKTPDTTKEIHARSLFSGEGEFTVEIYEGVSVDLDTYGTKITNLFCNNRIIDNTPTLGAYSIDAGDIGEITGGTSIWSGILGTGKTSGGISGLNDEIIAKRNTIYLFLITKVPTGVLWFDYNFFWYEHTNKGV